MSILDAIKQVANEKAPGIVAASIDSALAKNSPKGDRKSASTPTPTPAAEPTPAATGLPKWVLPVGAAVGVLVIGALLWFMLKKKG